MRGLVERDVMSDRPIFRVRRSTGRKWARARSRDIDRPLGLPSPSCGAGAFVTRAKFGELSKLFPSSLLLLLLLLLRSFVSTSFRDFLPL